MRTFLAALLLAAAALGSTASSVNLPPFLAAAVRASDGAPHAECGALVTAAIDAAGAATAPSSPSAARKAQRKALKATEAAVAKCTDDPLLLGAALSVRGGSLLGQGDTQQAALDYWSALGLTGYLDFAKQANISAQLAAGPAGAPGAGDTPPRTQRANRIRDLVWASQAMQALAGALEDSGFGDQARQAHAASQEYVLQRWRLQSSLPGLKASTGQRYIDEEEAGRRFRTQQAHAEYNKPNPHLLQELGVAAKHGELLTWGEGGSKQERRLRPAGPRRIVRNLKALGEALDKDDAAWDTEGGLRSVEPMYQASWGEAYGPYVPQFVPEHATDEEQWDGRVAATAASVDDAAAVEALAPAPGAMCELPPTYQYGPTAGTTTARFFEDEMFFAVFEDVFVEGPSGLVYDDNTLYLNSHAEFEPLASAFLGDGGAGAASQRPRTVISVDSALSLVHGGHYSYQQWTTDVLPRFFLAVEHLKNTAERSQREGAAHADDIRNMKILVPGAVPFVGAFLGLMGVSMESTILFVPSHTVVRAKRLWLPDWTPAASRRAAPPADLLRASGVNTNVEQAVASDGSVSSADSSAAARLPKHLGAFNEEAFALMRQALLQGDTSLYTHSDSAAHTAFRTQNNATCSRWTKLLAGKTAIRSFDKHAAEIETRAKPGTVVPSLSADGVQVFGEEASADTRPPSTVAPRGALHLMRQSFAEKNIPDPPKDVQLDIMQEVARAAEAEHGEKHRKRRGHRKFKKRKLNEDDASKNSNKQKGEWVDAPPAWRMFSQYGSPFTWDNGTVLAYPPIRTVLVVTRDLDTFVDAKNSDAVLDTVHGFFTEAVEEAHHGGMLPRDPLTHALLRDENAVGGAAYSMQSPATVMKVGPEDNDTMVQMTHPMVAEHYYASDVRAAHNGGVLYERALLRTLAEEEHSSKVKAEHAAEVQKRRASGAAPPQPKQRTSKLNGVEIAHPPAIQALPAVAPRMTIVHLDASLVPVAASIRLFQQADLVVGVAGSGLANIVFSHPTASVLEVAEHTGNTRHAAQIAAALGLDFWAQVPETTHAGVANPARASALEKRGGATPPAEGGALAGMAARAAPVTPNARFSGATVNTEHLRGSLAAIVAKRVRANAAAAERAVAARQALWERGLLDSRAAKKAQAKAAAAAAAAAKAEEAAAAAAAAAAKQAAIDAAQGEDTSTGAPQ